YNIRNDIIISISTALVAGVIAVVYMTVPAMFKMWQYFGPAHWLVVALLVCHVNTIILPLARSYAEERERARLTKDLRVNFRSFEQVLTTPGLYLEYKRFCVRNFTVEQVLFLEEYVELLKTTLSEIGLMPQFQPDDTDDRTETTTLGHRASTLLIPLRRAKSTTVAAMRSNSPGPTSPPSPTPTTDPTPPGEIEHLKPQPTTTPTTSPTKDSKSSAAATSSRAVGAPLQKALKFSLLKPSTDSVIYLLSNGSLSSDRDTPSSPSSPDRSGTTTPTGTTTSTTINGIIDPSAEPTTPTTLSSPTTIVDLDIPTVPPHLLPRFQLLFNVFVDENAPLELNLSAGVRRGVREQFRKVKEGFGGAAGVGRGEKEKERKTGVDIPVNVFEPVKKEVLNSMFQYFRFLT
ncbi:hypothetical protein HK102_004693, partial [Quaeritorhiza haematococci]